MAGIITVVYHPPQRVGLCAPLQVEQLELSPGGNINVAYLKDVFRLSVVRKCDERGENAVGIPYSPATGDSRGRFDSVGTLHVTGDPVDDGGRRVSAASTCADYHPSPLSSVAPSNHPSPFSLDVVPSMSPDVAAVSDGRSQQRLFQFSRPPAAAQLFTLHDASGVACESDCCSLAGGQCASHVGDGAQNPHGESLFELLSHQLAREMDFVDTPGDSGHSTSLCMSPAAALDTPADASFPVLSEEALASLMASDAQSMLHGAFGPGLDFLSHESLMGVIESTNISACPSPSPSSVRRDSAASMVPDVGSPVADLISRADNFDVSQELIPAGTGRLPGIPEGAALVTPQTTRASERYSVFLRKHVWYGPGEVMLTLGPGRPDVANRRVVAGGKGSLPRRGSMPPLVLTAEVFPSAEPIRVCPKCATNTCKGRTIRLTLPAEEYRVESAFVGGDVNEHHQFLWCFANIGTACVAYPFSVHFALSEHGYPVASWVIDEGQLDLRIKRKDSVKSLRLAGAKGHTEDLATLFADGISFARQMDYGHVVGLRTTENLMFRVWEGIPGEAPMSEALRTTVCMRPPAATYWSAVVLHQMEQYGDALRTCAAALRASGWAVKLPVLVPNMPDTLPIAAATLVAEAVMLSTASGRPLGSDEIDVIRLIASIARDAEDDWTPGCRELVDWIARASYCDSVYLKARIAAASGAPDAQATALEDCREAIGTLTSLAPITTDHGTRNLLANLHDLAGWLCGRFGLWDDKVRHHISALEWRVKGRRKFEIPWHDQALGSSFMSFALIAKSIETAGGSQSGQLALANASQTFSRLLTTAGSSSSSASSSVSDAASHDGESTVEGLPLGPLMMITRAKRCQEDSFRFERAHLDLLRISNHDSVHTRILRTFVALREARLLMASGQPIDRVLEDMRLIREACHRRTKADARIYDSIELFRRELDAQSKGNPPKPVLAHLFKM